MPQWYKWWIHIFLVLLINRAMGVQMMGTYIIGTAYQQDHRGTNGGYIYFWYCLSTGPWGYKWWVHIIWVVLINKAIGVQMMGVYNVDTAYQQDHEGTDDGYIYYWYCLSTRPWGYRWWVHIMLVLLINNIRKITLYFFGLFGLLKVQKGKKGRKVPYF